MSEKIYVVMHGLGMDGDYPVCAFNEDKKDHADKLCDMYNSSDDSHDYDYYYVSEIEINTRDLEKYYIKEEEGWKTLMYEGEEPPDYEEEEDE